MDLFYKIGSGLQEIHKVSQIFLDSYRVRFETFLPVGSFTHLSDICLNRFDYL